MTNGKLCKVKIKWQDGKRFVAQITIKKELLKTDEKKKNPVIQILRWDEGAKRVREKEIQMVVKQRKLCQIHREVQTKTALRYHSSTSHIGKIQKLNDYLAGKARGRQVSSHRLAGGRIQPQGEQSDGISLKYKYICPLTYRSHFW